MFFCHFLGMGPCAYEESWRWMWQTLVWRWGIVTSVVCTVAIMLCISLIQIWLLISKVLYIFSLFTVCFNFTFFLVVFVTRSSQNFWRALLTFSLKQRALLLIRLIFSNIWGVILQMILQTTSHCAYPVLRLLLIVCWIVLHLD